MAALLLTTSQQLLNEPVVRISHRKPARRARGCMCDTIAYLRASDWEPSRGLGRERARNSEGAISVTVDGFITVICACDSCTPVASLSVCLHVRGCLRACVFA